MKVVDSSETSQGLTVRVMAPGRKHIDAFIRLKCAPDLLAANLFPNSKEITESMAAFEAVQDALGPERLGDESVLCLDVGCGGTPRTAALMAFRSRWQTHAIDPALNIKKAHTLMRVERTRGRVEDTKTVHPGLVVVLMVHAHVSIEKTLRTIQAPEVLVVAMPCCMKLELPISPDTERQDWNCWSPQRTVKTWHLRMKNETKSETVWETKIPRNNCTFCFRVAKEAT